MTITLTRNESEIAACTPYTPSFPKLARRIGGHWDPVAKTWAFPLRREPELMDLLRAEFSWEPGDEATMTRVRLTASEGIVSRNRRPVRVRGHEIVKAAGRDTGAWMADGAELLSGDIGSGGSRQYWHTTVAEGSVVEIELPASAVAKVAAAIDEEGQYDIEYNSGGWTRIERVGAPDPERHARLTAERERLVARLAEIDRELAAETSKGTPDDREAGNHQANRRHADP